jgi:hypothetical protein
VVILLNGPLGIGKTTLADALMESIDRCVMIDGDCLVAVNPEPSNGLELLHSAIILLIAHHRRFGYQHFVINHIWTAPEEIDDLRFRLAEHDVDHRCFLLTLSAVENNRRIDRRASGSALDEREIELRTVAKEREMLKAHPGVGLGEPFDVSASPPVLVRKMLDRLGMPACDVAKE